MDRMLASVEWLRRKEGYQGYVHLKLLPGPRAALTLARERRRSVIRGLQDLKRLGVDTVRAGYFLTLKGRRLAPSVPAHQLRLFPHGEHMPQAPFKTVVPPCAYR